MVETEITVPVSSGFVLTSVSSRSNVGGDAMKTLSWLFVLYLFLPSIAVAQSKKIPVGVSHEGDDSVGQGVAFALKEAIRGSQGFVLVETNAKTPKIVIVAESVEALVVPLKGRASAIAYSIIYYRTKGPGAGIFLGIKVQSCGPEIIESCAKQILPAVDQATDFLRRHDPDLWKTL